MLSELPHNHSQNIESILEQLPATENFLTIASVFRQLGDPNRIRIFWLLCHCEECVINISALVDMSARSLPSSETITAGGLITSHRQGKEVYYKASDNRQAQLLHLFIEQIMEVACPSASSDPAQEE